MHLYIGLPIAFLAVAANSPIFALIGGILFTTALRPPKNFIPDATGGNLLKTGIVILGLTISSSTVPGLRIYFNISKSKSPISKLVSISVDTILREHY